MSVARIMRLLNISLVRRRVASSDKYGQNSCDEEENDVHDSKRPAGLEHCAVFVRAHSDTVDADAARGT